MAYADIFIVSLVALFTIFGFFKGFFKSAVSFFSFLISLILAIFLCNIVANILLDVDFVGDIVMGKSGSLYSFIEKKLPSSLNSISNKHLITAYGAGEATGAGEAYVKALFESGGFKGFFLRICYPMFKDSLSNPNYLSQGLGARQIIAMEMTFGLFSFFTGVLLFAVFRIMSKIISMIALRNMVPGPMSMPGRLGGMIIGAAKGFAYCLIILTLAATLSGFGFMARANEELDKSTLGEPLLKVSAKITTTVKDMKTADTRYERMFIAGEYYGKNLSKEDKKLAAQSYRFTVDVFKSVDWNEFFGDGSVLAGINWKSLSDIDALADLVNIESWSDGLLFELPEYPSL